MSGWVHESRLEVQRIGSSKVDQRPERLKHQRNEWWPREFVSVDRSMPCYENGPWTNLLVVCSPLTAGVLIALLYRSN